MTYLWQIIVTDALRYDVELRDAVGAKEKFINVLINSERATNTYHSEDKLILACLFADHGVSVGAPDIVCLPQHDSPKVASLTVE